ncbi:PQQ-like domain containing protein, partial [Leptotrombidium deliense]
MSEKHFIIFPSVQIPLVICDTISRINEQKSVDAAYYPNVVCRVYFNFSSEDDYKGIICIFKFFNVDKKISAGCGGGIMALEGKAGSILWIRYMKHELFAVNCNQDLTEDTIADCVVGGRMASLFAINGANGDIIWDIQPTMGDPIYETSNFYTPLYISKDIDSDNINDLLVMHGGDPLRVPSAKVRIPARLIFISSKTGIILSWSVVPDGAESYYSPQELVDSKGNNKILFGTGGETHRGSLFLISLDDLFSGKISKAKMLHSDCCKGVMVPPVLIDLNNDTVLDIIMALFNSTVIAIDGDSHQILWKSHFAGSETY